MVNIPVWFIILLEQDTFNIFFPLLSLPFHFLLSVPPHPFFLTCISFFPLPYPPSFPLPSIPPFFTSLPFSSFFFFFFTFARVEFRSLCDAELLPHPLALSLTTQPKYNKTAPGAVVFYWISCMLQWVDRYLWAKTEEHWAFSWTSPHTPRRSVGDKAAAVTHLLAPGVHSQCGLWTTTAGICLESIRNVMSWILKSHVCILTVSIPRGFKFRFARRWARKSQQCKTWGAKGNCFKGLSGARGLEYFSEILWLDKSCIESRALCPSRVTEMSLLGPSHPLSFPLTKEEQREPETFTELVSC